jgi:hypothetical protein
MIAEKLPDVPNAKCKPAANFVFVLLQ